MITKKCEECGAKFETHKSEKDKRFCSRACYNKYRATKKVTKTCKECDKEFKIYQSKINHGGGKFCSQSCANKYRGRLEVQNKEIDARDNPLKWSHEIAYLSGLITSDGCLDKKRPRVYFYSKDKNLAEQARKIVEVNLDVNHCVLNKNSNGVWRYAIVSRRLYYFLEDMGLMPNKSLKLGQLDTPDNMFYDWLRGEIDGDGSFYKDKQGYLHLSIVSGSYNFLDWISNKLDQFNLINGVGNVTGDHNTYQLKYAQKDSKQVAEAIYKDANYFLDRKYQIAKDFI